MSGVHVPLRLCSRCGEPLRSPGSGEATFVKCGHCGEWNGIPRADQGPTGPGGQAEAAQRPDDGCLLPEHDLVTQRQDVEENLDEAPPAEIGDAAGDGVQAGVPASAELATPAIPPPASVAGTGGPPLRMVGQRPNPARATAGGIAIIAGLLTLWVGLTIRISIPVQPQASGPTHAQAWIGLGTALGPLVVILGIHTVRTRRRIWLIFVTVASAAAATLWAVPGVLPPLLVMGISAAVGLGALCVPERRYRTGALDPVQWVVLTCGMLGLFVWSAHPPLWAWATETRYEEETGRDFTVEYECMVDRCRPDAVLFATPSQRRAFSGWGRSRPLTMRVSMGIDYSLLALEGGLILFSTILLTLLSGVLWGFVRKKLRPPSDPMS